MFFPLIPIVFTAIALATCSNGGQPIVTFDADAVQAKIEEMTGKTPEEQCSIYMTAREMAKMLGREDLVLQLEVKLAEAGIDACVTIGDPPTAPAS